MGYSFRLAARVLLYILSHRQDMTYHSLCYTSCATLAEMRNSSRGLTYCTMHIKEPLLLIDKSSLCGGSGFPFSLSEWSLTICLMPYNHRYNVLSASLNKTFLSFSLSELHLAPVKNESIYGEASYSMCS